LALSTTKSILKSAYLVQKTVEGGYPHQRSAETMQFSIYKGGIDKKSHNSTAHPDKPQTKPKQTRNPPTTKPAQPHIDFQKQNPLS